MPTRREAAKFKAANDDLAGRIGRDIRRAWGSLGAVSAEAKRDVLLDVIPALVRQYGDVAGALAADYFESTTGVRAFIVDPDLDAAQGSVRALAGRLFDGREGEAMSLMVSAATRHALQPGRSTIYQSSGRSRGVLFARVPEAGACDWCRIMSSRGAVYLSRETAGGEGNDYHDSCGCQPLAVRRGDELPYDAGALYGEYKDAWDAAGGTGAQAGAVAKEMRRIRTALAAQ